MNPSRARIEESLGKSWNAVLAARIRMPAVNTCSRIHMNPPPKIVEPTWESTEFDCAMCSSTRTCSSWVITVMPRNMVTAIAPMIASVDAAFLACGRRNAGTPSAMASTPVSAVAPEENARNSRNRVIVVVASMCRSAVAAVRQPVRHCANPTISVRDTIATKP